MACAWRGLFGNQEIFPPDTFSWSDGCTVYKRPDIILIYQNRWMAGTC